MHTGKLVTSQKSHICRCNACFDFEAITEAVRVGRDVIEKKSDILTKLIQRRKLIKK
jgi:hypothetical protein